MARKPPTRPEPDEDEAPPPPAPAPAPLTMLMGLPAARPVAGGQLCPLFPHLGPAAGVDRVKVTRLDPPDGYLGTLPATADEEMLRQAYGGRVYDVIAINAGGKHLANGRRSITINAPARMPGDATGPAPAPTSDGVTVKLITEMMRDREAALREQMEWKEREAEAAIKRREQEAEAALKRREHEAEIAMRREREQADLRRREDEARFERQLTSMREEARAQAERDRQFWAQQQASQQANNALILQVVQSNKPTGGTEDVLKLLVAAKELVGGDAPDPQLAMMGQVGQMLGSVAQMATAPTPAQLAAPSANPARALPPGTPRPMRPAPPAPAAATPARPAPAPPVVPGISPEQLAKLAALNDLFERNGVTLDQVADGLINGELNLVRAEDGPDDEHEDEHDDDATRESLPGEAQPAEAAQDGAHGVAHPGVGDGGRPGPHAVGRSPVGDG